VTRFNGRALARIEGSDMRNHLLAATLAVALHAVASPAMAQVYPSRPVTMIAPFPAGGPLDVIARIIADPMRVALGQPVVVENIAGAGGNIGTARVARAAPDGYTIGMGQWSTHVVNPITYSLPYNVLSDFEPIALLTITPQLIIARKDFPAKDVKELIAWLRANPGKASAATVGAAGGAQVATIYFQQTVGTQFQFVPYRGGHPAMQDLVSGQVDLMLDQAANALTQVRAGTIKAYAVMAKERWPALPDVPALDEAGIPGLHVAYWHALWAPKGTPKDVIAKLNAAVVAALADPAVKQRLAAQGQDVWPDAQLTPEALAAYHKAETEKWWPIVRASNLKAE
jgi:tripartite-type tricarboxylate transporter receptor subunit TctC